MREKEGLNWDESDSWEVNWVERKRREGGELVEKKRGICLRADGVDLGLDVGRSKSGLI